MKKYRITDDAVADLLCFYCEGKPAVWNWFFGCLRAHWDTKGKLVYCHYIAPDKILNQAITLAKNLKIRLDKQPLM